MRSLRLRKHGNPGRARPGQFIVAIGDDGQLQFIDEDGKVTSAGGGAPATYATLGNATDLKLDVLGVARVTPSGDTTLSSKVPAAGHRRTVFIRQTGTTPRTITFGSGFSAAGTVVTGSSPALYTVTFASDGTTLYETARSGPLNSR